MKRITQEWLDAASLDLKTIKLIISDESLTRQVAFHAQQAIEKSLKSVIEESGQQVPRIHSLEKLFSLCQKHIDIKTNENMVIALDSLYTNSRYPEDLDFSLPVIHPENKQWNFMNLPKKFTITCRVVLYNCIPSRY